MTRRQFANFSDNFFKITSRFCDNGRVGCYAIHKPNVSEFGNGIKVCTVDKEFHGSVLIKLSIRDGRGRCEPANMGTT